jgi:hypothetical protein
MDDYISREETAKTFCEKCRGYYDGHCIHRGECDVDVIQTAPAADVQPVKHGRWIKVIGENYECSNCKAALWVRKVNPISNYKYCWSCGYKMDGDNDGKD